MIFNTLIPELSVSDINKSIHFYTNILGFKIEYQRVEKKFAFLSLNKAQIMIEQVNEIWNTGELKYPFGRGVNFQIEVDDINEILSLLHTEKILPFIEPNDNWYRVENKYWGNREFLVQDPDGYLLRFSEDLGYRDEIPNSN